MKKLFIFLLTIIALSATPVYAERPTDAEIDYFDSINAYYYNPRGSIDCDPGAYSGDISTYGSSVEEKIWTSLTSFLTDEQAAGVLGNLQSESGLNPARHETSAISNYQPGFDLSRNNKVAYGLGLAQWSYSRRMRLYGFIQSRAPDLISYLDDYQTYGRLSGAAFLEKAGSEVTDSLISLEIEFLRDELSNAYSGFYKANTVEEATQYFLEHVEVPKNPTLSAHPERLTQASGIYSRYSGKTVAAETSRSGSKTCTNSSNLGQTADAGNLQEYVLKYAWPSYHSAPYTERKSDYAEAIRQRQAAGKYVGGTVGGAAGIDCGGFVTTLMQESGFAPNYNAGGGNTAAQESWVRANGWQRLNPDGAVDTGSLQPGDVAFTTGHTFVYVGNISGFGSVIASASYGSSDARAPMAGHESLTRNSSGETVRWYRKP